MLIEIRHFLQNYIREVSKKQILCRRMSDESANATKARDNLLHFTSTARFLSKAFYTISRRNVPIFRVTL